jgi:lysozyme family protein
VKEFEMAEFERAIPGVLQHEGGYVNDAADPGGATKYGISLRYLQGLALDIGDLNKDGAIDGVDIKGMTLHEAMTIYRRDWWDKYQYGLIVDQQVATKVFDMAVNMGGGQAHKLLQRTCNQIFGQEVLKVDGIIGIKTITKINQLPPNALLAGLREQMANFYRSLVQQKPALAKFLRGWLNRAVA